jgi:hypothetical protein
LPWKPLRLLILIDDDRGWCGRVVPGMKEMLEHRAFQVDLRRITEGPVDPAPYAGLILGSPVYGVGLKGVGPTEALTDCVMALPDLEGKKAAVFCVYPLRPGNTLDRMKGLAIEKGCEIVAAHAYSLLRPQGEHIIPAECMVRIRGR